MNLEQPKQGNSFKDQAKSLARKVVIVGAAGASAVVGGVSLERHLYPDYSNIDTKENALKQAKKEGKEGQEGQEGKEGFFYQEKFYTIKGLEDRFKKGIEPK